MCSRVSHSEAFRYLNFEHYFELVSLLADFDIRISDLHSFQGGGLGGMTIKQCNNLLLPHIPFAFPPQISYIPATSIRLIPKILQKYTLND